MRIPGLHRTTAATPPATAAIPPATASTPPATAGTSAPDYPYPEKLIEYYKMYRSRVEHEDILINHRLTWLLLVQTAFFTAFVLLLNPLSQTVASGSSSGAGSPALLWSKAAVILMLEVLVCVGGLLMTMRVSVSVRAATDALNKLRTRGNELIGDWHRHHGEPAHLEYPFPRSIVGGVDKDPDIEWQAGLKAPKGICEFFEVAWISLLVITLLIIVALALTWRPS